MTSAENMRGQPDQHYHRIASFHLGEIEKKVLNSGYRHGCIFHAEQAVTWEAGNVLGAAVRSLTVQGLLAKTTTHRPPAPGLARARAHGRASYEYRLTHDGIAVARAELERQAADLQARNQGAQLPLGRASIEAVLLALGCLLLLGLVLYAARADARTEYRAHGTSYCLQGRMADGTWVRKRSAASNRHPLGTRLRLTGRPGPGGLRRYVVRDRIGHGSELDLWTASCGAAIRWGAGTLTYKLGWRR